LGLRKKLRATTHAARPATPAQRIEPGRAIIHSAPAARNVQAKSNITSKLGGGFMQINESIENYLERILILQQQRGSARSVDIAAELRVTKPSVSHATKLLRENGYIVMDSENGITLTPTGREIAERMYQRHQMVAKFLISLGVQEETAFADACKMEHDISEETFNAICAHAGKQG